MNRVSRLATRIGAIILAGAFAIVGLPPTVARAATITDIATGPTTGNVAITVTDDHGVVVADTQLTARHITHNAAGAPIDLTTTEGWEIYEGLSITAAQALSGGETRTATTDATGVARFLDLPLGLWLVEGEAITSYFVTMPTAHPDEPDHWLYDFHSYPKPAPRITLDEITLQTKYTWRLTKKVRAYCPTGKGCGAWVNSLLLRDLDPGKPVYADYQLTVAVSRTVQGEISLTNAAPYPLSLDGASITLPNYLRPVAANGVFGEPVVGETTTTWPFAPGAAIPALQQLAIGITDVTGARIPSVAGELTVTLNGETTHFSLAALVTEPSRYNLLWDAYSEFAKTYGAKGLPILNCTTPNGVKRTNCIGGKATTPGFVNWLDAEDLLAAGSGSDGNTQFTYTVRVDPIALAEGKARNVAHLINPPDDDDAEVIITYRKKQTDPPGSDSNPPGGSGSGGSGSGGTGTGGTGSGGNGSGGTGTGGTGTGSGSGGSAGSGSGVVSTVAAATSAVVGAMTRTGVSLTGAAIALVTVSTGLVLSLRRRRSNSGA